MKKVLFAICFLLAAAVSNAQLRTLKSDTYNLSLDTVTTTTAHYMVSPALSAGVKKNVEVVVKCTEISGTTSGTATVEASFDGSTWFSPYNSKDSTYSLSLSDVTTDQIYRWQLTNQAARYYRVKVVGGGSVSVKISGTLSVDN